MIMIGDFRKFNQCFWKIYFIASVNFCSVRSARVWWRLWLSRVVDTFNSGSGGAGIKLRLSHCYLRQGTLLHVVSLHPGV